MITVQPAKITARPEVVIAVITARVARARRAARRGSG